MEQFEIKTSISTSVIKCGYDIANEIDKIIVGRQTFLVTDDNLYSIYKEFIDVRFKDIYIFKHGEKSKNFNELKKILQKMCALFLKRNALIVAFGGGVVGDIVGLAAALYMRGIEILQVPTSLLSMVDSSVGGKTAIDFCSVKNIIGAFYQPKNVICDLKFLQTLNKKEIVSGIGEIFKTALLNKEIFEIIEKNNIKDIEIIKKLVPLCIAHKKSIVEQDEKETGTLRKTLNLGHTTGHALELFYKRKSHGEYVLIGLYFETKIALKLGVIDRVYACEIVELIKAIIKIPVFNHLSSLADALKKALLDKKNTENNKIMLILPIAKGITKEVNLKFEAYKSYIEEIALENCK